MNFRKTLFAAALIATTTVAGCGNYSNEDLEFMNALPEKQDLTAEIPARSAILIGDAELYRMTRNVALVFNGIVDAFLSIVDTIRAYPATTRRPNERVWGPFPSDKQPGWLAQLVMTRLDLITFEYKLQYVPAADPSATPLTLMTGRFAAAGGARRGKGQIAVNTEPLRTASLDPDLGYLDTLTVDYDTSAFPITVNLMFTNFPNPFKVDDPTQGTYVYAAQANGQGALSFDFSAFTIPGPMGLDTFNVTSRWLGNGEGRADLQVVSGDGAGLDETQCWDRQFQAVYTNKPWAPLEDIGAVSDCPAIPTL
jgi:hypothetical protein